jgi:putative endonuclease
VDKRKQTGEYGETVAVDYLLSKGYRILERNWRCPLGELDIIAENDRRLIFVEVRARHGDRFGPAEASLTPAKQARLVELAHSYLQSIDLPDRSWQIDVVAVRLGSDHPRVKHIENAIGW